MGIAKEVGSIYKISFHENMMEQFWSVTNRVQYTNSLEKILA